MISSAIRADAFLAELIELEMESRRRRGAEDGARSFSRRGDVEILDPPTSRYIRAAYAKRARAWRRTGAGDIASLAIFFGAKRRGETRSWRASTNRILNKAARRGAARRAARVLSARKQLYRRTTDF